jgi:glucokinase
MGGTKCHGVVLDAASVVVGELTIPTPGRDGPEAVYSTLCEVADHLIAHAESNSMSVATIGIGVPGMITREGELRFAGHLGGRVGLDLKTRLTDSYQRPISIDNDNNAATFAEWQAGSAVGHDNALMVGFGTGIGGGIILGGKMQRGANGFAGEIGHIGIDADGGKCTCGRRGCWELFASGTALGQQASAAFGTTMTGQVVIARAAERDETAVAVVDRYAGHIATGLANLIMVLDPSIIVVGGGVFTRPEVLFSRVDKSLRALMGGAEGLWPLPKLAPARFGPQAAAVGAAMQSRRLP